MNYFDRVWETSHTTGTGDVTLLGAVSGYRTFSSAVGVGNTCYYCIVSNKGDWEVGLGTLTSSSVLARTTLLASSTGSAVSFTAGTKDVFVTAPASTIASEDWVSSNYLSPSGDASLLTGISQDQVAGLTSSLGAKEDVSNRGVAGGYAPLDSGGYVPLVNVPSLSSLYPLISNNLSDLNPTTARSNLGLAIGTDVLSPSGDASLLTGLLASHASGQLFDVTSATYGAVGDLTTDDSAAIMSAIHAAHNSGRGATVYFPPDKTFLLASGINLDGMDTLTLEGQGSPQGLGKSTYNATFVYTGGGTDPVISAKATQGITLRNLRIMNTNPAFSGAFVDFRGGGSDTANVLVDHCHFQGSGASVGNAAYGVLLHQAISSEVRDSQFSYMGVGIQGVLTAAYSNAITVRGCSFVQLKSSAIRNAGQQWLVQNCTFEPSQTNHACGYDDVNWTPYGPTAFVANWFGDASASGTPWIAYQGNGLSVHGCYLSSAGTNTECIRVGAAGAVQGVSITGSYFEGQYALGTAGSASIFGLYMAGNNTNGGWVNDPGGLIYAPSRVELGNVSNNNRIGGPLTVPATATFKGWIDALPSSASYATEAWLGQMDATSIPTAKHGELGLITANGGGGANNGFAIWSGDNDSTLVWRFNVRGNTSYKPLILNPLSPGSETNALVPDSTNDNHLTWIDGSGVKHDLLSGGGGSGTVTSVDGSGGTTGLTLTGGPITTSGTLTLGGTLAIANGGTGQATATAAFNALSPLTTLGDLIYNDGTNNVRLAGNTTATRKFLREVGDGTLAAAPAWDTLTAADIPSLAATYLSLSAGGTVAGATTFSAGITATAATSGVAITAKAAATTPGNIQEWKTNGGTLLSYIDSGGQAYIKNNVYVGSELHIARSDQGGNPAAASAKVYYDTNNALIFVDHTGAKTAFSVSGIGGYNGGGDNFNFPGYGNINTSVNSFILGGSSPIAAGTRLSVIGRSDQPAYPTAIIQGVASQTAPLLALQQLSSTATARDVANLDGYFADNTDASYTAGGKLNGYYNNAGTETARECIAFYADGTSARVGFLGATPVAQAANPGTATGTDAAVINAIVTILSNLGFIA